MDLTIRTASTEDFPEISAVDSASFGEHFSDEELSDALTLIDPARFLVAVDGERIVGVTGDYPFTMTVPGGTPSTPAFAASLPAFPANLRKQLKGTNMPAPRAILAAAVEGSQVDIDNASLIESRYFVSLLTGPVVDQAALQVVAEELEHADHRGRTGHDRGIADREGQPGRPGAWACSYSARCTWSAPTACSRCSPTWLRA